MLVLSRKRGERIVIGDGVELVVVAVSRGRVRLGIIAPEDVPVIRPDATKLFPLSPAVAADHRA